ncbi:MAG: two-component sensor histidine kinase, partial [Pseudonocardia sediminis]
MRRRILTLVGAMMLLVLVAFAVPLALLVRTVAIDRAVATATAEAQSLTPLVATADRAALNLSIQQVDATTT